MLLNNKIIQFIFISVTGVLLHFTYEWSGNNFFVGLFSAVNESTWEHLKLLFFPVLLLTLIQLLFAGKGLPDNFLFARIKGVLLGMLLIVVLFYTLWGVFGMPNGVVNILIYLAGAAFTLAVCEKSDAKPRKISNFASALILIMLCAAFFVFTYMPPKINLFVSPV